MPLQHRHEAQPYCVAGWTGCEGHSQYHQGIRPSILVNITVDPVSCIQPVVKLVVKPVVQPGLTAG